MTDESTAMVTAEQQALLNKHAKEFSGKSDFPSIPRLKIAKEADPTNEIVEGDFILTKRIKNDNDEYDTTAWKTWTLPRSAGNTVTLHWPYSDEIRPLPKYIKTKVKNNSGAGADTSITSITIRKEVKEL